MSSSSTGIVGLTYDLPMKVEATVTEPARKLVIAIAIVAVKTNRTSCSVVLKHAGRALFVWTGTIGSIMDDPSFASLVEAGVTVAFSSPSFAAAIIDICSSSLSMHGFLKTAKKQINESSRASRLLS